MGLLSLKGALCIAHAIVSLVILVLVVLVYRKVSAQGFADGSGGGVKMMVDNSDQFGEGFESGAGPVAAAKAVPVVVQNDYVDVPNIGRVTLTGCQVSDVPQDDAWSWMVASSREGYAPRRRPLKEGAVVDPSSGRVARYGDASLSLDMNGLHSSMAPGARRVAPRL